MMHPSRLPFGGAHWADHVARHAFATTPVAVVAPADPAAPPTLGDLTGWTAGRLASYKKPTGLVVLDELPRNASGKVLKHELRARYGRF